MSLVRLIRPGPEEAILYTDPDGPALREFIGRLDAQVDQILNKGDLCAQISRVLGLGPIEINLSPASGGNGGNSGGNSTPPSSSAWRKIGQGQCGIVFGMGVTPTTVVKVARQKTWHSSLRVDYESHNAVFESMKRFTSSPRVPRPYWLVGPQSSDWWSESTASLQQAGLPALVELPTVALGSEHIPPIPKAGRECLIDLFCPLEKREEAKQDPLNKDCLVRLYLGRDIRRRDKSLPVPEFSLRNFILHVNQMRNPLSLPIEYLAWQMAEALAIMHWAAHVDAYDVEFVLGSTPWDIRPMRDASRASTPEDDEKAGAPPRGARARARAARGSRTTTQVPEAPQSAVASRLQSVRQGAHGAGPREGRRHPRAIRRGLFRKRPLLPAAPDGRGP